MKIFFMFIFSFTLLFGYQKGDAVSKDIVHKLGLTADKIYVVDFFASWCGSCKKEMPYLSKVSDLVDKHKIEFIGIDVDEDISKAKAFQKELKDAKKLTFKVIDDPKNMIIREFNPVGMPALFFIKDLKVVDALFGAQDSIDLKIEDILKGLK